jgi:predicted dehydrogenase
MTKILKIGIIGAGKIVESNHLPVLLNLPSVTVSWLFDKSAERATLVSRMYNIAVINEQELEEKIQSVDICLITVPYGVREPYIRLCASHKKSVYVEKPFATTVPEHLEYNKLFSPPDIAIGFQRRYYPFIKNLKYFIDNKIFGKIISINFNQGYFQLKGGSGFLSDAAMSGGGVIIESAIHTLDQILEFTGSEDLTVGRVKSIIKNGIDYDTQFETQLETGGDHVTVNCHISCLKNLDNGLEIIFENAVISLQPSPDAVCKVKARQGEIIYNISPSGNGSMVSATAAFIYFWQDFVSAVHTRTPNKTSSNSSLLTTKWIEQLYTKIKSAEN